MATATKPLIPARPHALVPRCIGALERAGLVAKH